MAVKRVSLKNVECQSTRKPTQKEASMPVFTNTPKSLNDKSALTDGWHPAFLLSIQEEATPDTWKMYAKSPRMYRWRFAVWSSPDRIPLDQPERQSAPSSMAFSPKGKNPASKAYQWTTELLGRQILPGEAVDLDPLLPLPCRVKVERNGEYANIILLEGWKEGAALLTDELRQGLRDLDTAEAQVTPQGGTQTPPSWSSPGAVVAPAGKVAW
jgi:hypothetical protein